MNKADLIRQVESIPEDQTFSHSDVMQIVKSFDETHVIDKGELLARFMADDNTLFDIDNIFRILQAHKGSPVNEKVLDDIVDRFKKTDL